MRKSEQDWREELTPEQYRILREKGTEAPGSGRYYQDKTAGVYRCAGCGAELFSSEAKYDSSSGWPSFYQALDKSKILEAPDISHGMNRIEIMCKRCGSHLGHVFPDGPQPTGLRYCVNSASLSLKPKE